MKTPACLALLLLAGLTLAGCASLNTPAPQATAQSDKPEKPGEHFMRRNLEDSYDRAYGRDK